MVVDALLVDHGLHISQAEIIVGFRADKSRVKSGMTNMIARDTDNLHTTIHERLIIPWKHWSRETYTCSIRRGALIAFKKLSAFCKDDADSTILFH